MIYQDNKLILAQMISNHKDIVEVKDTISYVIDALQGRIIDERSQQVVIGTLILCEEHQYKIKSINPSIFNGERERTILKFMRMIIDSGNILTMETLIEEMKSKNILDMVGGITYITSMIAIHISSSDFDYHLNKLSENYLRRELLNEIKKLMDSIIDNDSLISIAEKLDHLRKELNNSNDVTSKYIDFDDIDISDDKVCTIKTGIQKLDAILSDENGGGIEYGTLSVLTGQPSSGKSTLMNQIVAECMLQGEKAFIYSGELPNNTLKKWFVRTVSNREHIESSVDSIGKTTYSITCEGKNSISKWGRDNLFIYREESKASESNLLATIEHLYLNKGVRLFILDNLMCMNSDVMDNKYVYQERIVKDLSSIAKKYGIIIILVAHPKKESVLYTKPTMYDVSGAAEIVNYADYVMMTLRPDENEKLKSGIMILKNRRNGVQDITVKLAFSEERKRFYTNELELNKDFNYSFVN